MHRAGPIARRRTAARPPTIGAASCRRRSCGCRAGRSRWDRRGLGRTPATARVRCTRSSWPRSASTPAAVSNARFAEFVDATGYRTDAERYGWSFVFGGVPARRLPADTRAVADAPVVAAGVRRRLAPPRRAAVRPRRPRRPPGDPRLVERRPGATAPGAAPACPPRPSGSTPPGAGIDGDASRGATSSSRAASTA